MRSILTRSQTPIAKATLFTFVLALAVTLCFSPHALAQSPPTARKTPRPPQPQPAVDQERVISYWTTETGWRTELQLRNNAATQDLTVTPALRLPDGAETSLAAVTIKPLEVKSISLDDAIPPGAPQLIGTYGSIVLRYRSSAFSALYAVAMVMGVGHSIAFHIDAVGEDQTEDVGSREGIWWLPDASTSDYLILANQGPNPLETNLSVSNASGDASAQTITLAPRGMARYSIRQIVAAAKLAGSYGGIRVSAVNHAGSLDTLHVLFNENGGFSAFMKMFDYDPRAQLKERDYARTGKWTLRAPMLALSNPDPSLAFPVGTVLQPQLFIRNITSKPVETVLAFNWHADSMSGKASGPALHLSPYETRRLDLAALQDGKTLPQNAHWSSVILTTNSLPGEVVAVAASYDQSLRYGAQTPFSDQLARHLAGSMWTYDALHDSIITVGNGGTKPTRAAFTIFYNQGTQKYELEQTLQPDEQMWIDVGKLIRESFLDKNGKTLPNTLTSGSYEIRDLTNKGIGTLFEGKVIYDKTYGNVTYGCTICCGFQRLARFFNPLNIPFNGTSSDGVNGLDSCSLQWTDISGDFNYNWTTADPSIATVDCCGTFTGQGVGSTTSTTFADEPWSVSKYSCPTMQRNSIGSDIVNPRFNVAYSAYIPVDNVQGPTTCNFAGAQITMIYMGDANRGTYRDTESIQITPDLQQSSGFFQDTGQTRNYGAYSPKNGSTLSSLDEDGIPNDCYLWNAAGKATPAFSYDVSYPYAHQGQVHYSGSSANPLESPFATITWDMRTVLDTTNPQSPTAYVNYNHTCYPAHQIKVNGNLIYSYTPPENDIGYITGCLVFHTGKIIGQTNPVSVPNH